MIPARIPVHQCLVLRSPCLRSPGEDCCRNVGGVELRNHKLTNMIQIHSTPNKNREPALQIKMTNVLSGVDISDATSY